MWSVVQWYNRTSMTYRPRISSNTHERVERYVIGKSMRQNQVYVNSVELAINKDGSKKEWLCLVEKYSNEHDKDITEVLNKIMTSVIDEDGDANIQFRQKFDLD